MHTLVSLAIGILAATGVVVIAAALAIIAYAFVWCVRGNKHPGTL